MVFSSPTFLLVFLPVVLLFYYGVPYKVKNYVILIFSLLFYSWGEGYYIILLVGSILINYLIGLLFYVESSSRVYEGEPDKNFSLRKKRKIILWVGITSNLLILSSFKYANFIVENINWVLQGLNFSLLVFEPGHLPVGISFFTFQALSYLIDIYKEEEKTQTSLINLALYISLFPQLIAGPIIRYHDISNQLSKRIHSIDLMVSGIKRFVFGLAKKVLIADTLGEVADNIFGLPASQVSTELAWLGIVCYTLQIYFDFSGYSDMAIGLGRMFGFTYKENFNYPYTSSSIKEFWRRWHISLSSWFKDYLYIPLGGNRASPARVYFNLMLVFVLCGLWHGASWNFIIWGVIHGGFLILERGRFGRILERLWKPLAHIYTLLVVMFAWVFFRAQDFDHAVNYLYSLLGITFITNDVYLFYSNLSVEVMLALASGILLAMPSSKYMKLIADFEMARTANVFGVFIVGTLLLSALAKISAGTYSPFIYFRF